MNKIEEAAEGLTKPGQSSGLMKHSWLLLECIISPNLLSLKRHGDGRRRKKPVTAVQLPLQSIALSI